jgi:hypothetical protein
MYAGLVLGIGIGATATTMLYAWMLIKANKRGAEASKTVEALLIRKAEGIERIASAIEDSQKPKPKIMQ